MRVIEKGLSDRCIIFINVWFIGSLLLVDVEVDWDVKVYF